MDSSSFFAYPGEEPAASAPSLLSEEDWNLVLAHTETRRVRPHEWLIRAGERDRALYLLSDGRLEAPDGGMVIDAPAIVGEVAFLDGLPHAAGLRALTHSEAQRLSFDAFEALAAREPRLARDLLLDVGRRVAAEVRRMEAGG
jgi:CRP/FNR family transcriptional regulator, cyclic AMP receptor protein